MFFQYSIYCINNGGCPFLLSEYKTFEDAKKHLYNIIDTHIERGRMFYVDNDFYNNKFQNFGCMKNFYYYKIVCRRVEEWHELEEENIQKNNSKILYYNFQKTC